MKFWKQGLALALSMTMALGLMAGCGGGSQSTDQASSASPEQAAGANEATDANGESFDIGIMQIVDHQALNAARDGFKDRMAELGLNVTYDEKNAQNDKSNLQTIAQSFVSGQMDLILAIATDSAVSAANVTADIPIVGTAITDYEKAKLVDSNQAPGANLTGTSDLNPIKDQMDLLQRLVPHAQTVGFVYSSSEPNSAVQIELAKQELDSRGLKYEEMTIASVNDIQQAAQSLVGKVDVFYVPTDNTIASAIPNMISVTESAGLVMIGAEPGMVLEGCTATIGISYYKLGQQAADMAKRILVDGEDPATMPIEFANNFDFYYNEENVAALGLEIPEDLLAQAVKD